MPLREIGNCFRAFRHPHRVRRRPSLASETTKRSRQVNGILAIMQQSDADNLRLCAELGEGGELLVYFFFFFHQIATVGVLPGRRETRSESNSDLVFHDGVHYVQTEYIVNRSPFDICFITTFARCSFIEQ